MLVCVHILSDGGSLNFLVAYDISLNRSVWKPMVVCHLNLRGECQLLVTEALVCSAVF